MAKIGRNKSNTISTQGKEIDLNTGDISSPKPDIWSLSLQNNFVKCVSLVEQIKESQFNLVDETNITGISYSLIIFGDKGRSLFDQVCLFQSEFGTEQLNGIWEQASLKGSLRNPYKFIKLCNDKGFSVKINEDEGWEYKIKEPGKAAFPITDELTEKDIEQLKEFSFLERKNCYYFAEYKTENKICTLHRKSNFTLRILFHITRGKQNKRVIELVNVHGRKVTADVETKQLTSFQAFKEFTEGAGNFIFEGGNIELLKMKNKLYEEEKSSQQIDMLGWNNKGKFFAFSNGIYDHQFHPVDEHGIVTLHDKNYFLPAHPGTDEYSNLNEKKFSFKASTVTFDQWSVLYCQAFGKVGEVALIFAIATLFSDHIFSVRGNFPLLFLYGEGGSGKSRVGLYSQYLWGDPQPPLKLSEKANTDKSKIRKLAQYINYMALFEEFINELDMSIIKTVSGIYDRFGYERSNMDSKYGTETVPINSTAFITGNSYPNDDPLMQRCLLLDYNANIRDEKVVKAYDELTLLNRQGLTEITGRLLQHRSNFTERFEKYFRGQFDSFKKKVADSGVTVPDRMIENYSVIITTAKVMIDIGVKLPFDFNEFIKFLVNAIATQAEKRDTGSVIQRFWDVVLQLANEGIIKHYREYTLVGEVVSIRFTEIHGLYMEKHSRIFRQPGLGKSTLLQKLKDSGIMVTSLAAKVRMGDTVTTAHQFYYDKLHIDLLSVTQYWDEQRKRYSAKSLETGDQSQQNQHWETQSQQIDSFVEKTEKTQNQPKNDDLPF